MINAGGDLLAIKVLQKAFQDFHPLSMS